MKGRRLKVVLIVVSAAITATTFALLLFAASVRSSSRVLVDTATLAQDASVGVPFIAGPNWQVPVQSRTDEPFGFTREWYEKRGNNGSLYAVEVSRDDNPISTKLRFYNHHPQRRYERDYPGLVREVSIPQGLGADDSSIFCGNVARSTTADLELCSIWNYWARCGQYIIRVEIYDSMSTQQFVAIVKQVDKNISAQLLAK
jgi:hypothetical protein